MLFGEASHIIEPHSRTVPMLGTVVAVKLNHVKGTFQPSVIEAVERHRIRSHGSRAVAFYYLSLHLEKILVVFCLAQQPFKLKMGIMPSVCGRGNILKALVFLTEQSHIPAFVKIFN